MSDKWRVTLPTFEPEVLDNSQIETFQRCPRKYLLRYGLRRAPVGENYSIGFGLAYHKYREEVENFMIERDCNMNDEVHAEALSTAVAGFKQPPQGHKKEFLSIDRLVQSCNLARMRIEREQARGAIEVIKSEDSFDLFLPTSDERFGGRMDQIIMWNGRIWIRDFKTTSYMGKTYADQFDPNNQMSGYVWAGTQLSGRPVQGVLIETVYNTKTRGPDIKQFLSTRSEGQIEQWSATVAHELTEIRKAWERMPEEGYLAFPQRTLACNDYGGCYYAGRHGDVGACSMNSGHEIEGWLEQKTQYSEWDFTDPDKEESKS